MKPNLELLASLIPNGAELVQALDGTAATVLSLLMAVDEAVELGATIPADLIESLDSLMPAVD